MLPDFLPFYLKFGSVREMGAIKNGLKVVVMGKEIGKSPDAKVQKFSVCVYGPLSAPPPPPPRPKLETFRKSIPSPSS